MAQTPLTPRKNLTPGIPIPLGDHVYILPPCYMGTLELHKDAINEMCQGTSGVWGMSVVVDLVAAALERNYLNVDRTWVSERVGVESLNELFACVMDVSGLLRKQKAEEASDKGASLGESTGVTYTPT